MQRSILAMLAWASVTAMVDLHAAGFADSVPLYNPGTGFATEFGSGLGYTNINALLGEPSRITAGQFGGPVDPFNPPFRRDQIISLGAGGSLTVGFRNSILDNPANPFGVDFIIYGNSGFAITNGNFSGGGITDGSLFGASSAQARVSISLDNVTYFLLDPARAPALDALFPTDGSGDFSRPVNPALTSADFSGKDLQGIRSLYNGSAGGAGFDLAWARHANGQPVNLTSANFVRVEILTGSAEIDGIAVVPEPGSFALLILGSALLAAWSRARRPSPSARSRKSRSSTAVQTWAPLVITGLIAPSSLGAKFREDFAADPSARAWRTFGEASLFQWNPTEQRLDVVWDSGKPNSSFYYPLGTILGKDDDFEFQFEVSLTSIEVGVRTGRPFTFQIAAGLIQLRSASDPAFRRGTGTQSPNLVEWNYFPDSGFGATVSQTVVSTNSQFIPSFTFPVELTAGNRYAFHMTYSGSTQTLKARATQNGEPFAPLKDVKLPAHFTDFRVDAFAVSSYSDEGSDGSILARGAVDSILLTYPDPPPLRLTGFIEDGNFRVGFVSPRGWIPHLERTLDFVSWTTVWSSTTNWVASNEGHSALGPGFYRLRADRP